MQEYIADGFVLTVRQLYYQLVARDIIPNTERSYKNTVSLVNNARLAALLKEASPNFEPREGEEHAFQIEIEAAEKFLAG